MNTTAHDPLPSNPNPMQVSAAFNQLQSGRANNRGEFTLAEGQTLTTLEDDRIGEDSVVILSPSSQEAAGAAPVAVDYAAGQVLISHAAAPVNAICRYVVAS